MTYNKILVPYDSSKLSDIALDHAIRNAKMSSISSSDNVVNVILFYVTPEIQIPFTFGNSLFKSKLTGEPIALREYIKELHVEIKSNAMKMLDDKTKEYRNIKNISLQSKVIIGNPADEIIKFAEDEKVDLIIMGTTGLAGVSKFKAIGSVARSVSEKAKCPVMLVR
ncbi:MAG: universal stress protein [Nitrososphaeraceae archaeon]